MSAALDVIYGGPNILTPDPGRRLFELLRGGLDERTQIWDKSREMKKTRDSAPSIWAAQKSPLFFGGEA